MEYAVHDMPNGNGPGPDGFIVNSFKACLETMWQDIAQVVEES